MTIVISIATMVRSKTPTRHASHFIQSEVAGCDEGGGDDSDGDSVVKALTALEAL